MASKKKSRLDGLVHIHTLILYRTTRPGVLKQAAAWVEDCAKSFGAYGCDFRIKYRGRLEGRDNAPHQWQLDIYAIPESRIRRGVTGIRCGKCQSEVVSLSRHDFRYCQCEACFIDGGFDYSRIGWYPGVKWEYIDCVVDMGTGTILESKPAEVRKPTPQELVEIEQESNKSQQEER